jgi:1,4-alpha-glucan branching enzyme
MSKTIPPPVLVEEDGWLSPYTDQIVGRIKRFDNRIHQIEQRYGSLLDFASGYNYFGINFSTENQGWWYREWAPAAQALFLCGDFNNWNRQSHPLKRNEFGVWEIFLPYQEYKDTFTHLSKVKVHVHARNGELDRIPTYIRRVVQNQETLDFSGQVWFPDEPYRWKNTLPNLAAIQEQPLIYEAHVGMATEAADVGTYRHFTHQILPRISRLGYNVVQLMAVQEHPYYGSFGYHVSNFYCPSSRFGTAYELKELIDTAHGLGMAVIMDIVHSHAVKNRDEGLNEFDGTDYQYFHQGERGYHELWDSKLFDYNKEEVARFLLSNVRYWLDEFNFDGFRFDGVTSMMYYHHGNQVDFDHYDKYFVEGVDEEAILYLQLANTVARKTKPGAIVIAEDNSGMPGIARLPEDGGIGFGFRLALGIPDFWIRYVKERRDEDWNIHEMWNEMINRRHKENTVAYAESHDQALVGDKTLAFWLMDKEMYHHMAVNDQNLIVDRGVALHKMIRLFTLSLGGEGYLNFMGNEFGHPEWIDFPRQGNNWSYQYARRQWSLADNPKLRYKQLQAFDTAMINLVKSKKVLTDRFAEQLNMDNENKVIIFRKNGLIFIFNFHPSHSIPDYKFQLTGKGKYRVILSSDDEQFGGFDRVDTSIEYPTNGNHQLSIYVPNRCVLVLEPV